MRQRGDAEKRNAKEIIDVKQEFVQESLQRCWCHFVWGRLKNGLNTRRKTSTYHALLLNKKEKRRQNAKKEHIDVRDQIRT